MDREKKAAQRRSWFKKWKAEHPDLAKAKRAAEYKRNRATYRATQLRRKFGITTDQYDQMLNRQGGVCAICKLPDKRQRLAVDHCHSTGKVRGLLCNLCNRAAGYVRDDPAIAERLVAYLKEAEWLGSERS